MARVVIEHLTKTFASSRGQTIRAVDDLCLTIEEKELLVLAGPSGCGKTTTLRLIAGLETPDQGSISMDGKTLTNVPPKDRDLAMVFQSHALYPHMTARENMAFGLKIRKHSKTEIIRRIDQMSAMLRIEDCLDRLPSDLSGGQRQRVALGRALVLQPKLLLLDEPLSNLDAPLRAQMRAELLRLHRELQFTMIYVTHDLEAMTLGQRIAIMKDGKLQQVADPLTIYRQPVNRFVAGFVGAPPMNFFNGRILRQAGELVFEEATRITAPSPKPSPAKDGSQKQVFRITLPPATASGRQPFIGKGVVLGIRPEHVQLAGKDQSHGTIPATLELIEPFGHETWLHLATAGHAFIASGQIRGQLPTPGEVLVNFDPGMLDFFDSTTGLAIV